MITTEDISKRISQIKRMNDKVAALNAHRQLHKDILQEIVDGHPYPKPIAAAGLLPVFNFPEYVK